MNEFYIDPMWFYWINTVDNLKIALGAPIIMSSVLIFVCLMAIIEIPRDDEDYIIWRNRLKVSLGIIGVCILLEVFIPSKNTCIEMMIARTDYISKC